VGQRLADAYTDVEAIRLTLWQAAWRVAEVYQRLSRPRPAKFWAADAGHRLAHTAITFTGG
jgi:alkylation response protein AidB-like acyl-CoA dehydrogenase